MRVRQLFPLLLLLITWVRGSAQLTQVGDGGPGPFKAQHMTVELTSVSPSVAPGGKVTAGLVVTLEEHWHVYWVNAGDSGEPPVVKWTAPAGVTVGPMQFPTPTRLPLGPLMDFGYEDTVAFPQEIAVAPTLKPGPVHLDAQVSWLVVPRGVHPGQGASGAESDGAAGCCGGAAGRGAGGGDSESAAGAAGGDDGWGDGRSQRICAHGDGCACRDLAG